MFGLFKSKKEKALTNDTFLNKIIRSSEYAEGNRCFHFANRGFFTLVDDDGKVSQNNSEKIIAVDDFNGDREVGATLFYTEESDEVKIKYWDNNSTKIAGSLSELFGIEQITEHLVTRDDSEYWSWNESSYHQYEISEKLPKCIFPNYDLRRHLIQNFDVFITDHKEFNRDKLEKFINLQGSNLSNVLPTDFAVFNVMDKNLKELIKNLNDSTTQNQFQEFAFNPSAFWGIINIAKIKPNEFEKLKMYGLLR